MSLPAADFGKRLERLGRDNTPRKPPGGPPELTPRQKLLVDYQLYGAPYTTRLHLIKRKKAVIDEATGEPVIREVSPEPGEPLDLIEAADVLRIRRRNARQLSRLPVYQNFFAAELKAFRDGERARSLQTMVTMRDEPGLGRAADRKVRLSAAQMLMGEAEGNRGPTVNVGISGQGLVAGIVVVRRNRDRDEPVQPSRTIEHEAKDGHDAD